MTANPTDTEQREHLQKLLIQFSTAMLVTHSRDGSLRARPMAIAEVETNSRLWFITSQETAKVHEIEKDTRVHVVCQNDRSAYLSLSGRADLVHDRAKVEKVWKEPFRVWFPGGKDDQAIVLISVQTDRGEYWDNEGFNKIKYLFATAKALASGTKPETQEGEQHGVAQL
jgi:general stress protein 26